ncbi:MAG: hypothetical protein GXP45_00730 [bacterium]|nr:hypothetical protein [bacterium]
MKSLLNNQRTAVIGDEIMNFLKINNQFRISVKRSFDNIEDASLLLQNKIEHSN